MYSIEEKKMSSFPWDKIYLLNGFSLIIIEQSLLGKPQGGKWPAIKEKELFIYFFKNFVAIQQLPLSPGGVSPLLPGH